MTLAHDELVSGGFALTWNEAMFLASTSTGSDEEEGEEKKKSKLKYTCPTCQLNVWGKPDIKVGCWECNELMELAD